MDLAAIQTEIATALGTIDGLTVFDYEVPSISGPTAFVGYPDSVSYNLEYGPTGWRMTLPVAVAVPNPTARGTQRALAGFAATSGAKSVKAAIDGAAPTNYSVATVVSVEFDDVFINEVKYAGAMFSVDMAGD